MTFLALFCTVNVVIGVALGNPAPATKYGKSHSVAKRNTCTATTSLDASQQQIVLDAHNEARRIANPTPYEPLVDLTWDDGLASKAQELADSCRFAHDVLYGCDGVRMGQNLAWYGSTYGTIVDDLTAHVLRWDSEKVDYNLDSITCGEGKVCGHYTQLVWADTTQVGCGYKNCNQLLNIDYSLQEDMGDGSAWLLVCNYSPAGNYPGVKSYETELLDPADLVDAKGDECSQWIWVYCSDPVYGYWASGECARTCAEQQ